VSEDLAHDAHLRAALRHAPDHALSPPSGLSQTIIAAARQTHRPVRATPAPPPPMRRRVAPTQRLRDWLQRLFAPRWAGAWAVGLLAALGLGLWLDLELQPVVEPPTAVATNSGQPEIPSRVQEMRAPPLPSDSATYDTRAGALAKAAPSAPARTTERTVAQGSARATPRAESRAVDEAGQRRREAVGPLVTQRETDVPSSDAMRQDPSAAQPAAPPAVAAAKINRQADQLAAAQAATREAAKSEASEPVAAASPALTLLRRAQGELANGSAVWTWAVPGNATMAPFDDAAQAWLWRVVQLARGRWIEVSERGESLDALEVRWWRDGWPRATLRIEAQGLRWIEPGGRIRYAPLDAGTLQRLHTF
jgi:hypothetical protein